MDAIKCVAAGNGGKSAAKQGNAGSHFTCDGWLRAVTKVLTGRFRQQMRNAPGPWSC